MILDCRSKLYEGLWNLHVKIASVAAAKYLVWRIIVRNFMKNCSKLYFQNLRFFIVIATEPKMGALKSNTVYTVKNDSVLTVFMA